MPITLNGDTGITTPMYNGSITANAVTPSVNMKNRIINGAMVIDQRNAGASVTQTTDNLYPVDRFLVFGTVTSKFTAQQNAGSVTPPVGFTNYLGITSSSAYSVGSGDVFILRQSIEGYNIADFAWGSANAKTVTLSFWVRSSLTGTFGGSLTNGSVNRSYPFTFTISSANTWEQKSVTIAGDTSGTWSTTNGTGIRLYFGLGAGSTFSGTANTWATVSDVTFPTGATSVVGTNGATFYITGVQLEVGSTATSFDYRPYGTELALCQRYYLKSFDQNIAPVNSAANGINTTTTAYNSTSTFVAGPYVFPVQMRAVPTVAYFGINGPTNNWAIFIPGTGWIAGTTSVNQQSSASLSTFVGSSGLTTGNSYLIAGNFTASAEL